MPPSLFKTVLSDAACGQRAAKFSACFLFWRESCFILVSPEAFYLPRTNVLGIPTGELHHEGCSRKVCFGRWLEAGPRGSRLLGEGHEVFSLVRSLSCIWPLCVPCMAGAPSLSLVCFSLAHTGMLLHNELLVNWGSILNLFVTYIDQTLIMQKVVPLTVPTNSLCAV